MKSLECVLKNARTLAPRARANWFDLCAHDVEMKDNLWRKEEMSAQRFFLHHPQFKKALTAGRSQLTAKGASTQRVSYFCNLTSTFCNPPPPL
jgi:hypothetical protein